MQFHKVELEVHLVTKPEEQSKGRDVLCIILKREVTVYKTLYITDCYAE